MKPSTNAPEPPQRPGSNGGSRQCAGPGHHAARGRNRDRRCDDRDRPRGRPPDDGRRPRHLSVDRLRALVGRPDGHDGRLRRQRSGDCRRTAPRGARHAGGDRLPDGHHRRDHERVRSALDVSSRRARKPRLRRRSSSVSSTSGSKRIEAALSGSSRLERLPPDAESPAAEQLRQLDSRLERIEAAVTRSS